MNRDILTLATAAVAARAHEPSAAALLAQARAMIQNLSSNSSPDEIAEIAATLRAADRRLTRDAVLGSVLANDAKRR